MKKISGTLPGVSGEPAVTIAALILCLSVHVARAGLDKYSEFVVADSPETRQRAEAVRVTYLGVNGYQFEANRGALLVDPYFTRAGLTAVAWPRRIDPNEARIAFGLEHIRPSADAVFVTHAHFDHFLDVPEIVRRTHARLVAGTTAVNLSISCSLPRTKCFIVHPGSICGIGPWRIRAFAAAHDRIFGWLPFRRTKTQPRTCPEKASDWRLGEPMAFLIEANGKRIYIDSGGTLEVLPADSDRAS